MVDYDVGALKPVFVIARMSTRRPPGGHSSISFGDDTSHLPSPTASPRSITSSTIGNFKPVEAATPTTSGRRYGPYAKSSVFGGADDDEEVVVPSPTVKSSASSAASDVEIANVTASANRLSINEIGTPDVKKTGRKVLTPPGGRSSNIFGYDEPVRPPPARNVEASILPGQSQQTTTRTGRRMVTPSVQSSFSLSHESAPAAVVVAQVTEEEVTEEEIIEEEEVAEVAVAALAAEPVQQQQQVRAAVVPPGLKSSVVFGDDSPNDPDFAPRKLKNITGRKIITPPGGKSAASFAEFAGGSGSNDQDDKKDKRIDPASMNVAGKSTGKHRVY
ncbi:hypothetical protein HDU76_010599 [Blyttiomyces sp. JEL0837]|nr:hypothetical protein HDU76_010599 [Blyttiomyces sp. JEL0837]